MTGSVSPRPADILVPAARAAVDAVDADPGAPTKLLVTGGVGTGKSTLLAAVRTSLRSAGRTVVSRPARGAADGVAVVVDDADLLGDSDLDLLTELAGDPASTVVIAAQPLAHHASLRRLVTALERENPAVALTPLAPAEVGRVAAAALGTPVGPDVVRAVSSATAGFPFLLRVVLPVVADGAAAVRQAARFGLIDRLRRIDEALLDTFLVVSLGAGLGPDDVAAALGLPAESASAAVDRAYASGLVDPSHPPPFLRAVHDGITQILGAARHHDIEVAVLRSQLELSTLTPELALRMAEHGLRDDGLAGALTDFATRSQGHAARAARLYRAAADAGATTSSAHLADALALTGDCATAGRLADGLLASDDPAERAAAVRIAASIAMHDGAAAQAAELFRWLGPASDAAVGAAATISALAAGDAAAARASADGAMSGPPTSAARAARSVIEGLVLTLDHPYPVAVATLSQSISADGVDGGVLPDTPAALVTLAALHSGDPVRARSVVGRAVHNDGRADRTDAIFVTHRHRLLLGWVHMQDGQLQSAAAAVPTADAAVLHRRDALWAAALRVGIARRSGDTGAMQKHWYSAMEVLAESSADLFAMLPLGELWVAAARLRQVDQIRHAVDVAFTRLAALGDPVLWSVPLHWAGVHAGILANAPDAVAPHGQALTAAAAHSSFAKALATAGRTWLRVLADHVEIAEVTIAARGLAQFGHTWDATRLAGQAALQTTDPRVSQAMLQLARDLKQSVAAPDAPPPAPADRAPVDAAPTGRHRGSAAQLSEREREVAELLLQGMPYREIGSQLFISAKTVEHHVARIRRRLGAESRSEMLSMLRAQLDGASGPRPT
ncbi:DNA-binding CsgD family transcriptional regulator [Mycolicibacterium iranicum]|uniref:DNA-binding CsgD family transcriptional regulator n=1 Tax=Mycolicibacterium iranicum TaxID=912594 RepID=A0A839PWJ5_MYCIR|nr:isoniazid response ATPase/transcriptional regulator IniR [Mycolicibacterium iranicum]MBB2988608.1 DNA-binding CsgD family transcriptional regulator [Mycolicibacterium iranicum]